MPTLLGLWPGALRSSSRPRESTQHFERLFEEEQRRRARSQSSRRSDRVVRGSEGRSQADQCKLNSADNTTSTHYPAGRDVQLQGHCSSHGLSAREAAERAREAAEQARRDILSVCPPERRALPGRVEPLCAAERLSAGLDCDEVLPGLVLASGKTVKTVAYMRELRVTHIINTASRDVWLPVEKLSNMGVDLFQFHVDDVPSANIAPFFRPVADMVSRAQQSGGLLVVNCLVGLSRSATVLAAALMILHHWSLARTLTTLRLRRQVKPNLGFMAQLITLEMKLKNQGHRLS